MISKFRDTIYYYYNALLCYKMKQKKLHSAYFTNFKSLEDLKNEIKTFMLNASYHDGFEDWSEKITPNGMKTQRIKVFKFIFEVFENPNESNTPKENPEFIVSIFTNTVTIRYGGYLWNQCESCFDDLTYHLQSLNF